MCAAASTAAPGFSPSVATSVRHVVPRGIPAAALGSRMVWPSLVILLFVADMRLGYRSRGCGVEGDRSMFAAGRGSGKTVPIP
jgi:hypothetical protein